VVRVALQALAAVLGGTQSLHCNGRDEALSLPTEDAARLALRTQQVIASETGVVHTVDPVGGAWAIEAATDRLEAEAVDLIARIDALGGTLTAIERGWVQQEVQEAAYRAQLAVDRGDTVVVGVNRYTDRDPERALFSRPDGELDAAPPSIPVFTIDPEMERRQVERVRAVRAGRSGDAWRSALDAVSEAARDGRNLVPPILAAVEACATVGEISDTMRAVFGEHIEPTQV
jgi:methylmalonyl-CoA mutase N-terminal domain/subunit